MSSVVVKFEYQYSITGLTGTWHDVRVDGDFFRQERAVKITDGVYDDPTWGTPVQIRFDGEDGYTPVKGEDYFDGTNASYISYAYYANPSRPATPIGGEYAGFNVTYPDAIEGGAWRNEPYYVNDTHYIWFITCVYTEDENGTWVKSPWSVPSRLSGYNSISHVLPGVDGAYNSFIFKNAETVPATPTTGSYSSTNGEQIPLTWNSAPQERVGNDVVWISKTQYKHVDGVWVKNDWSAPVKFSAEDGRTPQIGTDYFNAAAGTYTSFVFKNAASKPNTPTDGSYSRDGGTETEVHPVSWFDDPSVPSKGIFVWVIKRRYVDNSGTWIGSTWSEPVKFSGEDGYTPVPGQDYKDGAKGQFTSYVFQNKITPPFTPIEGSYDGLNETMPNDIDGGNWTDDPAAPLTLEAIWVSKSRYEHNVSNNTWENRGWSIPIVFSYVEDLIEVNVVSNNGVFFRNNEGSMKTLSAIVKINNVVETGDFIYKWTDNGTVIYVDSDGNYEGNSPSTGLIAADGTALSGNVNRDSINITASDVTDGEEVRFFCTVSNI